MQIRSLLAVGMVSMMLIAMIRIYILVDENNASFELNTVQHSAHQIARDASTMLVLSQEYLITKTPRSRRQWFVLNESLLKQIETFPNQSAGTYVETDKMHDILVELPSVFEALTTEGPVEAPALESTDRASVADQVLRTTLLANHLVSEMRRVSDLAFVVSDRATDKRIKLENTRRLLVWVSYALYFTMLTVLCVFIYLRLIQPLGKLKTTVTAVRKGDLSARANLTYQDELGMFSQGFDNMLNELQARDSLLKEKQLALMRSEELAREASDAKSAFLANMSHEIRTPMNAVIGLTYLLDQTELNDEQASYLGKIKVASKSLMAIINDVLDLSKIEAGQMTLETVAFDLPQLLDDVFSLVALNAGHKKLSMNMDKDERVPSFVTGDPTRLRQILINLLNNAVKFTEEGFVTLKVRSELSDTGVANIRFTVIDSGLGIARDIQDKLFTPFTQADSSTTRRFGGTGLGLSIVRQLAHLMGGSVGLNSEPGKGSEFWVELPFEAALAEVPQSLTGQLLEVMIVDDHPDDLEQLSKSARVLGWRMEAVPSGEMALARIRERLRQGLAPDVVVLDWKMPVVDGVRIVSDLHNTLPIEQLPALVMVTAYSRDSVLKAFKDQPPADVIVEKPVSTKDLFDAVNQAIGLRSEQKNTINSPADRLALAPRSSNGRLLAGLQVLVVDDMRINLEILQRILEREGAVVATASNGQQALDLLRESPGQWQVVLMDAQMPVMDGLEATRHIRHELGLTHLPVIAVSAGVTSTEREQAKAAGHD